jgi:hypothetical protein
VTWVDTVTPENGIADCVYRATRDTFGDAVSYTPCSTGVAESIQAVFFELPVDEQLEALGVEQSASGPMLRIRGGDLTVEPQRGDRVELRGKRFEVVEAEDDNRGGFKAILLLVS